MSICTVLITSQVIEFYVYQKVIITFNNRVVLLYRDEIKALLFENKIIYLNMTRVVKVKDTDQNGSFLDFKD